MSVLTLTLTNSTFMTNKDYLFLILKCALGYDDISKHDITLNDETLAYLYNAARIHSLFPIISKVLLESNLLRPDSDYYQPFRKQMLKYVCRRENFDYVLGIIGKAFDESRIPFMPLKGSVLKELYPESWMRTGTDIDILVKKQDLEKASSVLSDELGFKFVSKSAHDVVYVTESKVKVELHFSLNEPGYREFDPLKDIWSVSSTVDGSYLYKMSDEYFLCYHIAHMAKHFVCGGCGIRYIIDLRLILDKLNLGQALVEKLITDCSLNSFYHYAKELCDVIFLNKSYNDVTLALEDFILSGGVFGNLRNRSALGQAKKGSGFKYAMSRIFLPFNQMSNYYPVLKCHKWLLPFYHIKRWLHIIFGGGFERSKKELDFTAVSDTKASFAKVLVDNIEL